MTGFCDSDSSYALFGIHLFSQAFHFSIGARLSHVVMSATVKQLQQALRDIGLSYAGNKAEIEQRLADYRQHRGGGASVDWCSAAYPFIARPWSLYALALQDKAADLSARLAGRKINVMGSFTAFKTLEPEEQFGYVKASMTQLAAYLRWKAKDVEDTTPSSWEALSEEAQAALGESYPRNQNNIPAQT